MIFQLFYSLFEMLGRRIVYCFYCRVEIVLLIVYCSEETISGGFDGRLSILGGGAGSLEQLLLPALASF